MGYYLIAFFSTDTYVARSFQFSRGKAKLPGAYGLDRRGFLPKEGCGIPRCNWHREPKRPFPMRCLLVRNQVGVNSLMLSQSDQISGNYRTIIIISRNTVAGGYASSFFAVLRFDTLGPA